MKAVFKRRALSEALSLVSSVVPTHTPKDVIKNARLVVTREQCELTGTDLEVGIHYRVDPADYEYESPEPLECLLSVKRIVPILRESTAESLSLSVQPGGQVEIKGGGGHYRLSTENPQDYPQVKRYEEGEGHYECSQQDLKRSLIRTQIAADVQSTRYALGGVLFELDEAESTLVATDSRALAASELLTRRVDDPSHRAAVVPLKAASLVSRLAEGDEPARLRLSASDLLVDLGHATIYSRLVEGRFPKWRDILPPDYDVSLQLPVGIFHSSVRQSAIMTTDESKGVTFTFRPDGVLSLQSEATEYGQSQIEQVIDYYDKERQLTFDPALISRFLKVLPEEDLVELRLSDDTRRPALFLFGEDYRHLVMPMDRSA